MIQSKPIIFVFLFFFGICITVHSQTTKIDTVYVTFGNVIIIGDSMITPTKDTMVIISGNQKIKVKKNQQLQSQAFYDSLYHKSSNKRWSKELFRLLIRSSAVTSKSTNTQNVPGNLEYLPYNGLIINDILYHKVQMISGKVADTSIVSENATVKWVNKAHVDTRDGIIRKNLLIQKGELIDADRLADNERIFRSLKYIEDATFLIVPLDSTRANIIVVTKDIVPIGVGFSYSNIKKMELQLDHYNISGSGQGVKYRALYNANYDPFMGNQLEYNVSNLGKSFIAMQIKYKETPVYSNYFGQVTKNFNSHETKYGGGALVSYTRDVAGLAYPDSSVSYNFQRIEQNLWFGRSFKLGDTKSNLIFTAKLEQKKYLSRPVVSEDTNQYFQNITSVFGSVIFLNYQNIKTRYIRGFGRVEDVHVGWLFSGTGGYSWTEFRNIYYGAVRMAAGKALLKGGYLGVNLEVGTYFESIPVLGAIDFSIMYYTQLINMGRYKLRFGAKAVYVSGINRYGYEWINMRDEIKGISSDATRGKSKSVIGFEAILFTPAYLFGFKFAPYLFGSGGTMRQDDYTFYNGAPYSAIGAGVRIRNESLVFQTLDISFAIYTHRPSGGKTFNFFVDDREPRTFQDLVIGEPKPITF